MKKSLLLITICIGLSIFFYPTTSNTKEDGSPGEKTNSPMDGQNCTSCHSGTINSGIGTATITTSIPASGYSIGSTYTITITGIKSNCTKFGFELTAERGSSKAGTFLITSSAATKFASGTNNTAVTHKTAGTNGNTTKIWSMDWTATANSSVSTTFYAALMFANNNGNNSGDNVFTTSLVVLENTQIPSWDCDPSTGICSDPGTGQGTYTSLAACQSNCVTATWNCVIIGTGIACVDPGTGTGAYSSVAACDSACVNTTININEKISNLLIYPNPAKNTLTIDGNYISATIYDVFGKVVLTTDYQNTIDVSTLSNGIYSININTAHASTIKKIIIAK